MALVEAWDEEGDVAAVEVSVNGGLRYHAGCRALARSARRAPQRCPASQTCAFRDSNRPESHKGELQMQPWQLQLAEENMLCRHAELLHPPSSPADNTTASRTTLWRYLWHPNFPMNDPGEVAGKTEAEVLERVRCRATDDSINTMWEGSTLLCEN